MKLNYDETLCDCILTVEDDYTKFIATIDWNDMAALFNDILTYSSKDEMDRACIDRVLTLFAAYFDKHNYIGDEEYSKFENILKEIREELE